MSTSPALSEYLSCISVSVRQPFTYIKHGLPVNFTCTSSYCAGRVFIQLVQSKLPANSNNTIYKSCVAYLTSELTSL